VQTGIWIANNWRVERTQQTNDRGKYFETIWESVFEAVTSGSDVFGAISSKLTMPPSRHRHYCSFTFRHLFDRNEVLGLRLRDNVSLYSFFCLAICLREAFVLAKMFRPRRNDEGF